ncbi:hypothetical protein IKZ77_00075 [Candidatus Saccharibacteria bacterium]|nr:hypothetical protein [Candidatus Saccharibacteria bacterium]
MGMFMILNLMYLVMAIYRHYDLKKYVQIRHRAGDLILAVLAVVYVVGVNWN